MLNEIKKQLAQSNAIKAVILFGSFARDEANERSDVDLCIILKKLDKKTKETVSEKVLVLEKKLHKNIQTVFTDEKFSNVDRNFLETILREGKVLYGKMPIAPIQKLQLQPFILIKYNLSKLSQSKKMKIKRILYGKTSRKKYNGKEYTSKTKGLVAETGSERTGLASIMAKQKNAKKIENVLLKEGAKTRKIPIWVAKT